MQPRKIPIVAPSLYVIRGQRVILDSDLAELFGVSTKRLNEQIRRNLARFPGDFAFRLKPTEAVRLRSQIATSKKGRGGRRYLPFALTEHGVVMAANVLNSPRAVAMSVEVVRVFVRLRKAVRLRGSLAKKLEQLEQAIKTRLNKNDAAIKELFQAVESLIDDNSHDAEPPPRIGFDP